MTWDKIPIGGISTGGLQFPDPRDTFRDATLGSYQAERSHKNKRTLIDMIEHLIVENIKQMER